LGWKIDLSDEARKQLKRLAPSEAKRILDYLRQRIEALDDPRQLGKGLKGQFAELWRYRVGNYRVICELQDHRMLVLVIRIGHRKMVYR
jgi:mRNA interferase RelE/StbE